MEPLTPTDAAILELESVTWRYVAVKHHRALVELGLSPTRYAARLNALLDNPAAEAHDPALVHRLRRLRDVRRAARTG